MKGQQGMSQPWPRQQSGYNDMQLWQQQMMCRQLQELQKQQQLQQLDQESWQQNSSNQFSSLSKQATLDQLPSVVNGVPMCDVPNNMWQSEHAGDESRISMNPQMFVTGNMNWTQQMGTTGAHRFPNGLVFSQDQGQVLRSTGLVPQQPDQSLYGTPVSSNRASFRQYSQVQGVSNYSANMVAKSADSQVEKHPGQSGAFSSYQSDQCLFQGQIGVQDGPVSIQRFPGKTLFGQLPVQNVSNGIMPENFQQLSPLGRSVQVQEFRAGQERADWPGNSRERTVPQAEPARGMAKLDPTEEKLLYSTDYDNPWDASFGSGNIGSGGMQRNLLEGNNYFNAFPSVQSGSWSALMQSAVAETSSGDTGAQDEWSGLSFQQKELSTGNRPTMLVDSGKQQTTWVENLQSASSLTSRPFPLFDDTDVTSNDQATAMFQQSSFKSTYDHGDGVHAGVPHQSLQQPSKDASTRQLHKSQLHNQLLESNTQAQMHFGVTSGHAWAGQFYEQPVSTVPSEANLNQQSLQGTWAHQKNIPSNSSGARTYSKMNGWGINESGGDTILKVHDHENTVQQSHVNSSRETMHMLKDQDGNVWKADESQKSASFPHSVGGFYSGKSGIDSPQVQTGDLHIGSFSGMNSNNFKPSQDDNQQLLTGHKSDYGKHVSADSSLKGNEGMGKYQYEAINGPQVWEPSFITGKASDEAYERNKENNILKRVSDEGFNSTDSHSGQPIDSRGFGRGKDTLLSGSESHPSVSGDQKASDHTVRKDSGPRRFQFHPMGNLAVNVEPENSSHNFYAQGQSQMVPHGFKTQESGYIGQSQFAGQPASNGMGDTEKQHIFDSQRHVKGTEEMYPRGTIFNHDSNVPASFDESAAFFVQSRSSQTSQNMLELLHKVDQSKDSGTIAGFGFSNHNMISERADIAASDMPSNLPHSSALQGVGLHLALRSQNTVSSQHQPVLTHTLSSKAVLDQNSRHFDSEVEGEKSQTCPTTSVRPLPPMHEVTQKDSWYHTSSLSGQPHKGTSQSNILTNSTSMTASSPPCTRHDSQQVSGSSGRLATDHSENVPSGDQLDLDARNKGPLHIRQLNDLQNGDMHDETVADQSGRPLLPGVAGRIAPFSLGSHLDARLPVGSQQYSNDMHQPRVMNITSSYPRNSSQFSGPGTLSVSQTPCVTQQGAFSAMLHNVWTNVSAQQRLSGNLSTKGAPNMSPSVTSGVSDANTCISQRADAQGNKKGQSTASCSINSQQFTCGEEQTVKDNSVQQIPREKVDVTPHVAGSLQVPESLMKHTTVGNSSTTIPSLVRLQQQGIGMSKHEQGLTLDKRAGHASLLNVASSTRDIGSSGHSLKSFDIQQPNYSLLQQVQAMKSIETDPSKPLGKRPKGADSGIGAQQITGKTPQTYIYGYNTVIRVPSDKELSVSGSQSSFPSDSKMLCFSSEANVDQNMVKTSQLIGKEVHSQGLAGARNNDMQNHPRSLSISSTSSMGGAPSRIDPQMAPSWFGQYGNFKNEQTLSMYSGLGGPQKTAKAAAQHYFFSKASESTDVSTSADKRNDSIQVESVWQSSSTTGAANEHSSLHYAPPEAVDHALILRPKKRKTATSELLPWRKEIMQGSEGLRSVSTAELNWVCAANRLVEKVEDETETSEGRLSVPRARRRLLLTTHLMQQLVPAVPRKILSSDATSQFDSVTYLVAKKVLGDACGGVSCSRTDPIVPLDSRTLTSEKLKTSEMVGEQFFSKVVEAFIGRASKLESDLSRFEKRASISDIKIECQDIERVSIINRFAKFHGRGQAEGVESSSASDSAPRKIFPQRYVTALSMPGGNLPEGVFCLSL